MSLRPLLDVLATDPAVRRVLEHVGRSAVVDVAAAPGARAPLTTLIATGAERPVPVLAVTATGREAQDLAAGLRTFLPAGAVAEMPSWETLPHERLSPRSDTVGRRLGVLRRLAHPVEGDPEHGPLQVVVASVRALMQPIAKGLGDLEPVALQVGDERPLEQVVEALAAAAYTRTDMVERRGEFAVRGGIVDVFPPTEEHPLRVEFFGDEVDEVRHFKVADQRTIAADEAGAPEELGLWAPPCRELLLTDDVRLRAAELAEQLPGVADLLHKVAEGIAVEGMESLMPALLADGMETLLDVLPEGTHVVLSDPERVRTRAHDLVATSEEFLQASWANAAAGNAVPVDLESVLGTASYWGLADLREHALETGRPWWSLSSFASDEDLAEFVEDSLPGERVTVPTEEVPAYRGNTEQAVADLRSFVEAGRRVLVVTEGAGLGQRVSEVLRDNDIPVRELTDLQPRTVEVATGSFGHGFALPTCDLVVLTEADLTGAAGATGGSTKDMRKMPSRRRNVVDPLQLRKGDFVVHEQHGVGKFVEMMQRTVAGATREYLVVEYASSKRGQPGDRLFVPTDQLDQVTRYVGGELPTLNKLGGSDWQKTKSRARRHVRQIAGQLIQLYSARMASPGHAFAPDTPWQRELEDAFAYIETPDQLSSIDEVKADMEKSVPMDRLICGDVGYGKTEIAVRAAFKAIQDGKQVAVLVPTTLLVKQHQQTFSERYAGFPVTVRSLSRFQSDKEAREVIAGLADGSVDLVIGTHRLLSNEIRFKDLGLVVVDEEQRFGVEHKEQLKQLRTAVDVLAMSATPIPRTLEMAVTGIREMSTLATPPEERHPVLTFVGGYDEKQITAAIRRELMREGQVFFVHNKVQSIEKAAARLRELVPEARITTAHGKMSEQRLEEVVVDFWERRSDVLVCTTIVETGLDISNANTLIVERSDVLGLSQLHQLRGRVGRGRERAYAYFLFPPDKPLTETAHDRLETIASHTDLGAGMQVAMKDLEIRGAGNLLGGEQSGHIAGVGFDLYVRMVGEAVADFRSDGTAEKPPSEVKIELPVDAHLPHDYVPGERLRLEAYKKLATVEDEAALAAIVEELEDRYGTPPEPAQHLIEVARLRTVARRAGISDIAVQGKNVRFSPVDLRESQALRLQRLYKGTVIREAMHQILVPAPRTAAVGGRPLRDTEVLQWARQLIEQVLLDSAAAA
ncbi:transcription-repair coupling factor (superfamily II helicase) [Barrientosiimonas humi]|uniref:Transcription-repair-coupling factor n=1 Tax=Barrientosiimonas humi TaxID=999931 RepID=A0A542XEL6_9MICO|nr:transcription-repair coupling factor [Barrientosiimonas humi]TQL34269.1 transcription-repair coupling factor (superfamily II helicase) [Barrientosiimonas humi]CAG7574261.1 Transcription-repair-coupling factor [Barrientosiimonas humi]